MKPVHLRKAADRSQQSYGISERRACSILNLHRSTHRYQCTKDEQAALRTRLKELAGVRVRYGYRRLHILLLRGKRTVKCMLTGMGYEVVPF